MKSIVEELLDVAQEAARLSVRARFLEEWAAADSLSRASDYLVASAQELQASLTEPPKEE